MVCRRVGDEEASKALRLNRGFTDTAHQWRLGHPRRDRWVQRGVDAKKWGEVPPAPGGRWVMEREGGLEGRRGCAGGWQGGTLGSASLGMLRSQLLR